MSFAREMGFTSAIVVLAVGCTTINHYDDEGGDPGGGFGAFGPGAGAGGSGAAQSSPSSSTTSVGGQGTGATGGGAGSSVGGGGGAGGGGPSVVLNEVAADGDPRDWIELKNLSGTAADISGWSFHDSSPANVYTFPSGTVLGPNGYLVVERWDGVGGSPPDTHFDFGLGADAADNESVHLLNAAAVEVDATTWTVDVVDPETWSRVPDGTGPFELSPATRGASND